MAEMHSNVTQVSLNWVALPDEVWCSRKTGQVV